jgi:hypothetical protein
LAAAVTGETGTGALVFGTNPTFSNSGGAAAATFNNSAFEDNLVNFFMANNGNKVVLQFASNSGSALTNDITSYGSAFGGVPSLNNVIEMGNASGKVRVTTTGDVLATTGNVVIGTSGKGIDFSATAGTGTSELFADYEEGTFTPTVAGVTLTLAAGRYTKIGRTVFVEVFCRFPATVDTTTTQIGNLPFTPVTDSNTYLGNVGVQLSLATHERNVVFATGIEPRTTANAAFTNANFSSADVHLGGSYTA